MHTAKLPYTPSILAGTDSGRGRTNLGAPCKWDIEQAAVGERFNKS